MPTLDVEPFTTNRLGSAALDTLNNPVGDVVPMPTLPVKTALPATVRSCEGVVVPRPRR